MGRHDARARQPWCAGAVPSPAAALGVIGSKAEAGAATPPVSARIVALGLFAEVLRRKRALDEALDSHIGLHSLASRDRAFARLIVATALRRLGQIDALIDDCLDSPLPAKAAMARDVLRLGIAQLLFLGTPAHAAVHSSVELVEAAGHTGHKGLVNAILRRLSREGRDRLAQQDPALLNTPDWLWQSWTSSFGEPTARAIAAAHLDDPPLDLTIRADAAAWAERLGGKILPTGSLRLRDAGVVAELPGYAEGAWWVQDAAAALPARLLGALAGRTAIDLCAAPGGKTAQLIVAGAR
ncbi:MAG: MFS transporter, partial [Alphaproteobacteria bacterium]|nr:MFS transporter [Alphaproteobacteria bacterium]